MTLGDIVKKYRESNNMSLAEFAQACSLSKGYISMLENNINPRNNKPISPTLPSIVKIAAGMGLELDALLKMIDGEQPVQLADERSNYTEIEIDLIASYRLLNKENQNRMLAYTRNLLSNQQMEDEVKFSPRYSDFSSSSVDFEEKEIEHHENTEGRIG